MEILVYGYGNPGRQDDGLGPEFIARLEEWVKEEDYTNIELDSNYQLNIEDADTISSKDIVIFVDATTEEIDDFVLTTVVPNDATIEFTMHAVSSSFIIDLCQKLYNKYPETYLLHIKGYKWELQEGLTEKAEENLCIALAYMKDKLRYPEKIAQVVTQ
ncbi:MAG: hydrogenase maturation protease [Bacteroidetes bacterium]|nr:hydrogenase maturation protease [Bacteroidota bacterium]MBU1720967.1 hydrogenase maturation protease [Bacteroidota bacterium]